MISLPPGLIMIAGALVLALTRGATTKALSLLFPLLTIACIWTTPQTNLAYGFLGFELPVWTIHPATLVFSTVFALMAFAGALFALNQNRRIELPAAFLYAGSAIGVTFSGDLFTMFVYWELMAVGSTIVVWAGKTEQARKAGLRYVNVHLIGGVILFAGITLHVHQTGNVAFTNFSQLDSAAAWIMLIGILVNSGTPPLGSWLPDAYPEASVSGTVFLSAYTTKTTVFVLICLYAGTDLLIYIGAAMSLYGIIYAILENDVRRILAYSIVNQVGFMVCAVGIGTPLAINGASAHAFAHIIYKALLLMSAGSVLYMTGKRKCTDVGGLYRTMPLTMWCGIIGALAISAMPLTSGFTTKSMITDAAAREHLAFAWFVLIAASAGVFLHAGIKFPWFVFFQKDSGLRPKDPPWNMRLAMLFFAGLCLVIGIYPDPLYQILPFPAEPGIKLYEAYHANHVVAQMQLLMFSGLAFFLLLPMLKRTLTITLDFDWFYRTLFPAIWKHIMFPVIRSLEPLHVWMIHRLPVWASQTFGADGNQGAVDTNHEPDHLNHARHPVRTWKRTDWDVGSAVLLVTIALCVFLSINLFF